MKRVFDIMRRCPTRDGYSCAKSLRWYSSVRPRLFPIATYSLPVEKSMLVTCPSGVPCVGQLEYAVREGKWIY